MESESPGKVILLAIRNGELMVALFKVLILGSLLFLVLRKLSKQNGQVNAFIFRSAREMRMLASGTARSELSDALMTDSQSQ